jgi:hypothetical protein
VITAAMPPEMIPSAIAAPSLLAHILVENIGKGMPLFRMEESFDRDDAQEWVVVVAVTDIDFDAVRLECLPDAVVQRGWTDAEEVRVKRRSAYATRCHCSCSDQSEGNLPLLQDLNDTREHRRCHSPALSECTRPCLRWLRSRTRASPAVTAWAAA